MPLRKLANRYIIEPDYSYQEKYWPVVSQIVKTKHGEQQIDNAVEVQETLKECFAYFCNTFRSKLTELPKASFFVFVQDLHEDSIEIWRMLLHENYFQIDEGNFAASRRIMKYVLEQGCALDLVGHPSFSDEISENADSYVKHLDELIYIGGWAYAICEYIARSQICEHSVSLKVDGDELTVYVNVPFNSIFEFIAEDNKRHNDSVVVSDSILDLQKVMLEEVKIDYNHLCSYIYDQIKDKKFRFSVFKLDELIDKLADDFGYSKDILRIFYSGLTVNKSNLISVEDGILKTQDARRYIYRPILEYTIGYVKYWIIGGHKWTESLGQLTTNCIPFGQFPEEWKQIPEIYDFMKHTMEVHDALLEDPAIEMIKALGLKCDRNVKSLKTKNNQGISLLKQDLGEIDIIFIDEKFKIIFVVECKHNRSRYEYYSWRRDISNFKEKYEKQLYNKHTWVAKNKELVLEHFEILHGCQIQDKQEYDIVPLFLINAPTLYMYDSDFLVFTLHDFDLYLNHKHKEVEFEGDFKNEKIQISKPLFKNTEKYFT